ncbi:MAG: hypothetical protein WB783_13060, partial [Arenicellales bacterium]
VDASGDAGGGDINIGGDYQGKGERLQSRTTTVGQNVTIRSDATGKGDAGRVVVWSKGTTRYSGSISARGGPQGGDGGQVEVSGKANLGFWGTVDAGATQGSPGSLLLDPDHLTIIDAQERAGDLDADPLCARNQGNCYLPVPQVISDGLTAEQFQELGIDPDPETRFDEVSWGRLQRLVEATGLGIVLQADGNVAIAPLNGTVSTPGSPIGGTEGWTMTLALANPASLRFSGNALSITSTHGDIVFENPNDNLAVYGGYMSFSAPEGELHLGNLYGLGPTGGTAGGGSWRYSSVLLSAGGDIDVGTIDTRNDPGRFADPLTGAPQAQPLLLNSSDPVDYGDLDAQTLFSDPYTGGFVDIESTDGNINITGPVYTGGSYFSASTGAGGTFTATDIDTGADRLLVRHFAGDTPRLNTLNASGVSITADKITFDTIHAYAVDLEALNDGPDAVTGAVTIDDFSELDVQNVILESFDIGFLGAEGGPDPIAVPLTSSASLFPTRVQSEGPLQIPVPRGNSTSPTGVVVTGITFIPNTQMPASTVPGPGAAGESPITVGLSVFGDTRQSGGQAKGGEPAGERKKEGEGRKGESKTAQGKGKAEKKAEDECTGRKRLAWLTGGGHSAVQDIDWGQRPGVGAYPTETEDVFTTDRCAFQKQVRSANAATSG